MNDHDRLKTSVDIAHCAEAIELSNDWLNLSICLSMTARLRAPGQVKSLDDSGESQLDRSIYKQVVVGLKSFNALIHALGEAESYV